MAGVWPTEISFVYGFTFNFFYLNQSPWESTSGTVYEAFNFSPKLLNVLSKQLT